MKQIKIALKDIKSNPFKKEIDGGKLNDEQIAKLIEGYKQTTFHENLLARKNTKGQVELVYGHHRLEAAKRVYGKSHQISLNIVDYNDEQMIVDLCRENLTQRFNEFRQEMDSVLLVRSWLEKKSPCPSDGHGQPRNNKGQFGESGTGARDIADFLSKEGKTICKSKVADLLSIHNKLDNDILEKTKKFTNQQDSKEEGVTYRQALVLSRIEDKAEQKELLKVIQKSGDNVMEISKKINIYKEAPEDIKEKVKAGKLDISDVESEVEIVKLRKKIDEGKQEQDQKIQIIKAKEIVDTLRSDILDTHRQLDGLMYKIGVVRRKGFGWYSDRSKKDFRKLVSNVLTKVDKWKEELLEIQGEIGD